MQQGIKKLQWFEYLKVVFLEILNAELCRVFANQVTYVVQKGGQVTKPIMHGYEIAILLNYCVHVFYLQ